MRNKLVILFSIFSFFCNAQDKTAYLTKSEIKSDLIYLDSILQNRSSYQGLNGYNYNKDFDSFLQNIDSESVNKSDFGLFLTKTIGKMGDRHSYVRGYDLPNNSFLPFVVAPLNKKVVALSYNNLKKTYRPLYEKYPFLKSINTIQIGDFLKDISPRDIKAPDAALHRRNVKQLKYMAKNYAIINKKLPKIFEFVFTNGTNDTIVKIPLEKRRSKYITWNEKFARLNSPKRKNLNNPDLIKKLLHLDENHIAYMRIPSMVDKKTAPLFFQTINDFMLKAQKSNSLIVDVRGNGGGTRDLIQALAGYFIHPDSLYVTNLVKQRGELPLNDELKENLHSRYLFSKDELDSREQNAIDKFMSSFEPMYDLDSEKYSPFHYYILNGQKLSKEYHYAKPIYILANERTFSAASILVTVFKGLPNIKIVGVNTDGSSGNSGRVELPNSGLTGRISTMVSFQKDGKILDGIGTKPDIEIERSLDQIYWNEDYQLNKLKEIIKSE